MMGTIATLPPLIVVVLTLLLCLNDVYASSENIRSEDAEGMPFQHSNTSSYSIQSKTVAENPATTRFREYIRAKSDHPNPNYDSSISWIKEQAERIGLDYAKIDLEPPNLFAVILKWSSPNVDPSLGSILLHSHIDVVSVESAKWIYPPFDAVKDSQGNIYGRGTQDCKSQGAQYLEAIDRLKSKGFTPKRTIYVSFLPDEELGGFRGMEPFTRTREFKDMNVSLMIDEGFPSEDDEYQIFYGERIVWQFNITATGNSTHGSLMVENNSGTKLLHAVAKLLQFRESQMQRLKNNADLGPGDVTSVNLCQIGGGHAINTVPSEMWAQFDMRIRVESNTTLDDLKGLLDSAVKEAGPGVSYNFIAQSSGPFESSTNENDYWWKNIKDSFKEFGWKMRPKIFPAATDGRLVRAVGIPVYGISSITSTPPLPHQDNEFLNENMFLHGISVFEKLIGKLTNAPVAQNSKGNAASALWHEMYKIFILVGILRILILQVQL